MGAIALGQWENLLGRAKLALRRVPPRARTIDTKTFEPPDSVFARRAETSPERTLACATAARVSVASTEALMDAICVHTTPGVSPDKDGEVGCYLQWGAMADGAGLRLWDISASNVQQVLARYPRVDFKRNWSGSCEPRRGPCPRVASLCWSAVVCPWRCDSHRSGS